MDTVGTSSIRPKRSGRPARRRPATASDRRFRGLASAALFAALGALGGADDVAAACRVDCTPAPSTGGGPTVDALTPVVALAHTPEATPFLGSDGKVHLVYELRLMNARAVAATLLKVEAVDAATPGRVVGSVEGAPLLASLRTLGDRTATRPVIDPDAARLVLMHLVFDSRDAVPAVVSHRLRVLGGSIDATDPTPVARLMRPARSGSPNPRQACSARPCAGAHWVAINGCCEPTSLHRNTGLPVDGDIHSAQRFAIDWMRLGGRNRLLEGDPSVVGNYTAYGAEVIAVADGTVVDALDSLPDQLPPTLPPPKTITLANVDGNHLVIDIGDGRYAFYAHLQPGADRVRVKVGDKVRRGQRIGTLGNSGNTSAPHLHFHVMDGPSVLGSNGLPFVIEGYAQSGQVGLALAASSGLDADFSRAVYAAPRAQAVPALPLDFAIVDFAP